MKIQNNSNRSPIFIQFLDCLYQIMTEYPTYFEFNINLLWFLAHHLFSWKFGTFLLDSDRYRFQNKLAERTVSIWTYVNDNWEYFINPFYFEYNERIEIKTDHINIHFWREYFLQWTDVSSPKDESDWFVKIDLKEEVMKKLLEENKQLKLKLSKYESNRSTNSDSPNENGHL